MREEAFCLDCWHLVRSHDHDTFEQRRAVPLAVKLACCKPFSRQHTASKGEYLSISLWQWTANYVKELAWGVIPLAVASSIPYRLPRVCTWKKNIVNICALTCTRTHTHTPDRLVRQDWHDSPFLNPGATQGAYNLGVATQIFQHVTSKIMEDRGGHTKRMPGALTVRAALQMIRRLEPQADRPGTHN